MKTIFWCDLHQKGLHVFFCKVVQHFLKTNNVGRHFCPDFYGFGPDFQQIKTLGGPLAPLPPTPLRSHPPPPRQPLTYPQVLGRYRDCHIVVLKALQDQRAYGPQWTNKHVTQCLTNHRDEYKYNVEAVELLIRSHLVNLQQYDQHLAQVSERV